MRIGIDARFFGTPGKGLGRYTEKLVRWLEEVDLDNDYEIFLYGESFHEYEPKNPRFKKIQVPYRWYGFAEQLFYPFFLKRRKLDLVHFPHFNVPIFLRQPFVVTIHDLILLHYPTQKASTHHVFWYRFKYMAYLFVIQSALKRAKGVFAVSRFTRDDVLRCYPWVKEKMSVTIEGVDQFCYWLPPEQGRKILSDYWVKIGKKDNRPYVLYVGNSYPHKNLDIFLQLAKIIPDTDIILVGKKDYFYERLKNKIEKESIQNIFLIGGVPDTHLGILYKNAKGYVFPSLYEGFGLPPLEAMQHGIPVLVSNRGSLPEVVGKAALIADPDEIDAFSEKYQTLLFSDLTRSELIKAGFTQAASFSWQKMAEATKDLYTKAVSG